MQKAIGVLLIVAGFFVVFMDAPREALGQTLRIITPTQGGTGIGSTTAGNIGNCLKVSDESPFTYELGACGSGGGSGTDVNWSFTAGNTFISPATTTNGIIVRASSTIGDGTVTGGLTVNGSGTTTGTSTVRNLVVGGYGQTLQSGILSPAAFINASTSGRSGVLFQNYGTGTAPEFRFTIGDPYSASSLEYLSLGLTNSNATAGGALQGLQKTDLAYILSNSGRDMLMSTGGGGSAGNLYLGAGINALPLVKLDGATNRVGIGLATTTTPTSTLSVNGDIYTANITATGTASSTYALNTYATTTGIFTTNLLKAYTSAGTVVQSANGTPVSIMGVGNSANALFYGGVNIDGTTRLATSLNGLLKATSGTVSAGANGTDYTLITGTTCSGTDKVSAVSALGVVTCSADTIGSNNWVLSGTQLTPSTTVGVRVAATTTLATTTIAQLFLGQATTTKQSIGGGGPESIQSMRPNANDLMLWSGNPGDTEGKFLIESQGLMGWGAGGASDQDINFYRSGAGALTVQSGTTNSTDAFRVNQFSGGTGTAVLTVNTVSAYVSTPWLLVNGAGGGAKMDVYGGGTTAIRAEQPSESDVAFSAFKTADAQLRFSFLADGTMKWGSGALAGDVSINRTAVGSLSVMPQGAATDARFGIGSSTPSRALTVVGNSYFVNNGTFASTTLGHATSTSLFSTLGTFTNTVVNTLLTAASAVFTGLVDIGGGVLEIPNGSAPTVDSIGELAIDSTSNQLVLYGSEKKVIGNGNQYSSFTYATSTAWTGTTTIPLGTAFVAETWNGIQCFTDAGTLKVSVSDGTNRMNPNAASTTVGTTVFNTNNTFTANEKRYVDIGTPASSPTKISCTVSKSITAD